MIKVLFYSDVREYGGHEAMTVAAARFLACQPELHVSFIYHDKNQRLGEELRDIAQREKLTLVPLPLKSEGPPLLRLIRQAGKLPLARRVMKHVNPTVVVICQGNIGLCWLGLLAAKSTGFRIISYIPMAHPANSSFAVRSQCRALLNRVLYRVPDKFITINESAKRMLREGGAKAEIEVVRNGIELNHSACGRAGARRALGFSEREYIAAVIGRITFGQKAQDFFVEAIARYRRQLNGFRFCVIGEGPDEQKLRMMINNLGVNDCVFILPWHTDLSSFYSAVDAIVIPSHFEGVPLVMLEAMWYGLPIVASNVDGMAELLPPEWLFRRGDTESLVNTLQSVRRADNSRYIAVQRRRVAEEFNMQRFQRQFYETVTGNQLVAGSQSIRKERVSHACASELI